MRGEELDFNGELRTEAKLSQMVGGKKSFFLKAIDPFFSKEGAGTLIPIGISGTRDNPTLEISMFHKKIRKSFGDDSNVEVKGKKCAERKKTKDAENLRPRLDDEIGNLTTGMRRRRRSRAQSFDHAVAARAPPWCRITAGQQPGPQSPRGWH